MPQQSPLSIWKEGRIHYEFRLGIIVWENDEPIGGYRILILIFMILLLFDFHIYLINIF